METQKLEANNQTDKNRSRFPKGMSVEAVATNVTPLTFYVTPHIVTLIPNCTRQRGAHLAVGNPGLGLDRRAIH
jgi:hypothetical protein